MAGKWEKVRLGDLVKITHGWPFKSECFAEERAGRPIIVSIGNFRYTGGFRFESTTVKEYTADYPKEYELTPGDILLVMTCQTPGGEILGIPGRIPDDGNTYLHNQRMGKIVIKDRNRIDPSFAYYLALWPDFNRELCVSASGTKILHTAPVRIEAFEFRLPPLAEQKAIASVLGALDDKIELNRRMNATLEAMARALFQSWFVDFAPVRAKQSGQGFNSPRRNGEAKGFESPDLHLFPDSFQDSELGPIPKGWAVTTLGKACEEGGGNIQTGPFGTQLHASDYVAEGIPSIMPSDLRDNRIDISSIARIREQDARRLSVYRVQTGDVVYSRRGDVERRSLIRKREDGWLCGTGCLRVRFGPQGINPFFAASYLGTAESRAWVVRHAVGATMPNLNTSILGALPMIIPPPELQTRFAEIVGPWDELGTLALEQSRTLATLRDTLLPKLLSGELSTTQTA